jgi:hypothetical protein
MVFHYIPLLSHSSPLFKLNTNDLKDIILEVGKCFILL